MLTDVIGHENQSQHYQHHRCVCLDLYGLPRLTGFHTTPAAVSYTQHTRCSCSLPLLVVCAVYASRHTEGER